MTQQSFDCPFPSCKLWGRCQSPTLCFREQERRKRNAKDADDNFVRALIRQYREGGFTIAADALERVLTRAIAND